MFETVLGYLRRHHIALLALFISLGGVSYAATQLPKNSVGTKQLKKNAVTAKKIKKNAITSQKVKDRSLLARDFKRGQLPRGATGRQGPTGPRGPVGEQGPPGPLEPGVRGIVARRLTAGQSNFNQGHTSYLTFGSPTIIDAPTDGYVLANVTTKVQQFSDAVSGVCNVETRLRHDGTHFSSSSALGTFAAGSPKNTYSSHSVTDSFPVSAGQNEFELVFRMNPNVSSGCVGIFSIAAPVVNLLWVPEGQGSGWPN